jgi:tricorn protease
MSRPVRFAVPALALASAAVFAAAAAGLEECRLLRQPDIQGDRIVFVYAGDLWTVPRTGGTAMRLTAHPGIEVFPKLSPDGKTVAFTAEYDGNVDAYTVPVEGGEPIRLTWHPMTDQVAEWYPDGKSLLLRSTQASPTRRTSNFFKIAAAGGFPEMLPLPSAGYATFSSDGGQIAYVSPAYDNRTWKRYKGGAAPDIWTYDFAHNKSDLITDWPGSDEWPMWHGDTIYYCSDRDGHTANIWAWDTKTRQHRQVTKFTDFDVKWPSIGGDALVFENGGYLWVMDLPGEKAQKIQVLVPDDKPEMRAEFRNVSHWIRNWDLSPSAKRAVLEARGELFTVPAEKGDVRNLTQTSVARERNPVWSPDGKWIAYLSDASGEYEVHVIGSDGKTPDRQVTQGCNTYRFHLAWSPDSKKIAFNDKTMTLSYCDVQSGKITRVDKSEYGEIQEFQWSPDSRWIAYAKSYPNWLNRVMVYALDTGKSTSVSTGMSEDFSPSFDPSGKYLYFLSRRTFRPEFGTFEFDFQFHATDGVYAATLQDSLRSPVLPQSDEETGESGADKDSKKDADKEDGGKGGKSKKGGKKGEEKKAEEVQVRIDLDGVSARIAQLPISPGRYAGLTAVEGKLVFIELAPPDPDSDDNPNGVLHFFDLEKREDKVVLDGVEAGYALSKDGGKLLYRSKDTFGIVDVEEDKKVGDGKIETDVLMANVDPKQEFAQMFHEAWRLERDFYYDPNMGGVDWKAIGERYGQLVPYAAHRADLNYILGELIGELSTSHTYVGGGDFPDVARVGTGLLGADFDLDSKSGRYRFKTVYAERDWNSKTHAPLGEPGVHVKAGDYLLAVNGHAVRAPENVYTAFVGTIDKQTTITVGSSPNDSKPRTYSVEPVESEQSLRYTAWVNANRDKVTQATGGRIAYIHVPNTSIAGIQEFSKQFYPQVDKEGIIVDERFNGGGFVPDFFVERLWRTTWVYWSQRDGADWRTPLPAMDGPKCIMVNQYAGSGGDAFPYYFRLVGLGPIIGKRTWGGLVGISHDLPLVDGGRVTMPDFGMWDRDGKWTIENHGVDPDIEVENTPSDMVAGRDPQLERAIQYCMDELKKNPVRRPARPAYKTQVQMR